MTFGERVKERRIELGWTQEELAEKMGYKSKSSINKIELGINDVTQSKIIKFAEIYIYHFKNFQKPLFMRSPY